MKNPSVNSIVERRKTFNKWFVDNHADPDGKFTHMPKWLKADLRKAWDAATAEAATIISELQGRISDLEVDLGNAKHSNDLMDEEMGEWKARALTAESSLSRIKEETIEECARVAEDYASFRPIPEKSSDSSLALAIASISNEACKGVASAIRSLGSTGDAEKTAESDHSPSTQTTATE